MNTNPEVTAWFENLDNPMADAMQAARLTILEADNRVSESIKWSTPTFSYRGNIVSISPAKKFVGLMFHRGADIPGDHPLLTGDNPLVRTMRFDDLEAVETGRKHITRAVVAWCDMKDTTD